MFKKGKGIDNGYLYTKDNEGNIFKSTFNKDGITLGGVAQITINGVEYSVGGAGIRDTSFDKTDSEMNHVGTLTSLAMTGNGIYYLGVGLPIKQYPSQKDKFKKQIMAYNNDEVVYQGHKMNIQIADVIVLPQGVGALMTLENLSDGNYILWDFGGYTIDIVYIEVINGNPVLIKSDTWTHGIQKIYPDVANVINAEWKGSSLDTQQAENILKNYTKGIFIDGEWKPNNCLLPVLRKFLDEILVEFNLNYPARQSNILLCGGSAIIFEELFKSYYPQTTLVKNSQFANANGYYKVVMQVFGDLIRAEQKVDVPQFISNYSRR